MGVGDSLEARYELRGALPAGSWSLRILPVARGATLHADVLLQRAGGAEQTLFTADSNVGPGGANGVMEGGIDVTKTTAAFDAACGDRLIVRVKLVALSPGSMTHWYFRLTTP